MSVQIFSPHSLKESSRIKEEKGASEILIRSHELGFSLSLVSRCCTTPIEVSRTIEIDLIFERSLMERKWLCEVVGDGVAAPRALTTEHHKVTVAAQEVKRKNPTVTRILSPE